MEYVKLGAVTPHPPIMIPEIGSGEERKVQASIDALNKLAGKLSTLELDAIVVISPHGPVFEDGIGINGKAELYGSFGGFGHPEVSLKVPADIALAEEIVKVANEAEITTVVLDEHLAQQFGVRLELDHGVLVPFYFLQQAGISLPVVSVTIGLLSYQELYRFGMIIATAATTLKKKIAIIASGDLSHRLSPDAPAGFHPAGEEFDRQVVTAIQQGSVEGLIGISAECVKGAGECGMRPIIMMLGSLDRQEFQGEVLSYEGPFGVGYMVATLQPGGKSSSLVERIGELERDQVLTRRKSEDALVRLARETLETYIRTGKSIDIPQPLSGEMTAQAGVFVSLKKHGQLRGCIGTIMPTTDNIGQEIINNAIQAGTQDPRFFPVEEEELDDLVYSVDVLMPPEVINSETDLDVQKYGVIVRSGRKTGLLLPNLEGVDTVEEQVEIAKQKAGIDPDEEVALERFEVIRHR